MGKLCKGAGNALDTGGRINNCGCDCGVDRFLQLFRRTIAGTYFVQMEAASMDLCVDCRGMRGARNWPCAYRNFKLKTLPRSSVSDLFQPPLAARTIANHRATIPLTKRRKDGRLKNHGLVALASGFFPANSVCNLPSHHGHGRPSQRVYNGCGERTVHARSMSASSVTGVRIIISRAICPNALPCGSIREEAIPPPPSAFSITKLNA